jgi:acyl-CoA thioester hydrolase
LKPNLANDRKLSGALMAEKFVIQRRVEFCETDAAGIVHFASYLCYMEQAEHAFLRSLGLSVCEPQADGWHLGWPRVRVECDFQGSAKFEDLLEIRVGVARLGNKSITYDFVFMRGVNQIAKGRVTAVCCNVKSGQPLKSTQVPKKYFELLDPFNEAIDC